MAFNELDTKLLWYNLTHTEGGAPPPPKNKKKQKKKNNNNNNKKPFCKLLQETVLIKKAVELLSNIKNIIIFSYIS